MVRAAAKFVWNHRRCKLLAFLVPVIWAGYMGGLVVDPRVFLIPGCALIGISILAIVNAMEVWASTWRSCLVGSGVFLFALYCMALGVVVTSNINEGTRTLLRPGNEAICSILFGHRPWPAPLVEGATLGEITFAVSTALFVVSFTNRPESG